VTTPLFSAVCFRSDEGISSGCCAYGLFGNEASTDSNYEGTGAKLWKEPLSPYLGPAYDEYDIQDAIDDAEPWLDIEEVSNEQQRLEMISRELASSGVVALFNGRSEVGPRALGHRSILADPRKEAMVKFINNKVKGRESFRPFAPSCLAEEAHNWFEGLKENGHESPYMSITAMVKGDKRELIPAVTHVDGSSRLQTVTKDGEPMYHQLISTFFKQTGVPMVLNTSFNTLKGEPIVESPKDAIRSFLCSMGSIEMLVMGDYIIKRKMASIPRLVGERKKGGAITPPQLPVSTGPFIFESSCTYTGNVDDVPQLNVRVRMPDRPMHDDREGKGGWYECTDELEAEVLGMCDGSQGVEEMIQEYVPEDSKEIDKVLFQNVMNRLCRLFEHTLISW
jgi:hypothetical protein